MTAIVDTSASNLVEARTALAAAIETATGYTCHPSSERALATPCYVLESDGWQYITGGLTSIYRVRVTCLYANQAGDLADGVEELARAAAVVCVDNGWRIADVPAPGSVTFGGDTPREFAGVQFLATLPVSLRSN